MSNHRGADDAHWLGRDHVRIVKAANSLDESPEYARQMIAACDDPLLAAVELVQVLMTERVEAWAKGWGDE